MLHMLHLLKKVKQAVGKKDNPIYTGPTKDLGPTHSQATMSAASALSLCLLPTFPSFLSYPMSPAVAIALGGPTAVSHLQQHLPSSPLHLPYTIHNHTKHFMG